MTDIPYRAIDAAADPHWAKSLEALDGYRAPVEALFGLPDDAYDRPHLAGDDGRTFLPRLAKWPAFRKRNVALLLGRSLASSAGPEVWLDATATGFELGPDGRVAAIEAASLNGRKLRIAARQTVIAAGAIESTRLLLLLDRQADERLFAPHGQLGRYFHDHLSAPVAEARPRSLGRLNRLVGFQFQGAAMRNLRFESAEAARERGLVPAFVHIGFEAPPGGFDALREILRAAQAGRPLPASELRRLALAAPWIAKAGWWRLVERRLAFPPKARFYVHAVTEQTVEARNRIGLSATQRDVFGLPRAEIDWRVSPQDVEALVAVRNAFCGWWEASRLAPLAALEPLAPDTAAEAMIAGGGIFHPGGTARVARSAADGVVDADFRTHAIPNLWVCSTAAFPRIGAASPTMTLLMAALRVADLLEAAA